jgi:hypothetical protein
MFSYYRTYFDNVDSTKDSSKVTIEHTFDNVDIHFSGFYQPPRYSQMISPERKVKGGLELTYSQK